MPNRTVFFVSDQTGVTAETMGHSLLTQFEGLKLRTVTLPFIASPAKAREARERIDAATLADGLPAIVFSTLIQDDLRIEVQAANAVFLDFFHAFIGQLEAAFGVASSHAAGRAHGMTNSEGYAARINATNFALANDDGAQTREYGEADVILVGVSRSGKTPTCLYLALHYGLRAANYPLTEEDLEAGRLPAVLQTHRGKLYGLTIDPVRLQRIRHERRPNSKYSSAAQVAFEVRAAKALLERHRIPYIDTTACSVEEIGARVVHEAGIGRRAGDL